MNEARGIPFETINPILLSLISVLLVIITVGLKIIFTWMKSEVMQALCEIKELRENQIRTDQRLKDHERRMDDFGGKNRYH